MQKDKNIQSYLKLHLIVFIWGFTAILGKLISLEALPLVWYRMAFALAFIILFIAFKKKPLKLPKKTIVGLLFAGLIIALHWLTFFKAIKESNISVTLACLATGAFFASILEPIFYKRKVIFYEVLFGLIVIIGLYIIFQVEGNYVYGIILALSSAFLSASFSVINGKYAIKYDATIISFYEILGGLLSLSIFMLFNQNFTTSFFQLSTNDLLWLLVLSSFCTAYAFIASIGVMKYLSPYTVMLTINLEPIYGIILALIIFNDKEKMSTQFYIGALIILSTVILNGVFKNRKK
ncbi:DMT family transporter [Flavobacterium psychrophilum]|jgi:drug/metabolite transporter (DMT)-like permease|uniref:EamA domain-containing protein n=2 Tax=Flavobacterium psychrophilum TaxID=96345 RepID=A6GX94_FLAPJ|nr:DMT family transporter [Flavobacterium psychrophilum]AIG29516.1 permease [Flavobacterium psychrophilum]AIG31793.1 permease [Flavobacterium psychrophilum]AIG33947.1 permease [Flavobacterium psychrophilum]AIG36310.1 permease [Flavobacterium psychrophilum]AIG38576.1 permease [Flavobacterium psychrophilum]